MADQLFQVFELPDIPDDEQYDERYRSSVSFDFEKGDFVRDGANRMVVAEGKDVFLQWCLKTVATERDAFLAYSTDIGTEFEELRDVPDRESRESEIERMITEALLVHPACEYVRNFEFEHEGDETWVTFTVKGYPWEEDDSLTVSV
ncbi:MAG: DUF2634 domain-containing protein [Lachnospiraceae bacterium]|nr:DUF2634 domain-containing protein [Lachnospiraceae bacterium]